MNFSQFDSDLDCPSVSHFETAETQLK